MDVTTITSNNIPVQRINQHNTNIEPSENRLPEKTATNLNNHSFDYSKVMMNLEEVKDFLFMLIGSEAPGKTADIEKGSKVNLFA